MMTNIVIDVLGGVLQVALVGLLSLLFAWLRSRMKSERLTDALEALENAAVVTVGELQQTAVEGMKAASSDGKLTKDEAKQLGDKALGLIMARMGDAAQSALRLAGMDVEDLIRANIENAVLELKKA